MIARLIRKEEAWRESWVCQWVNAAGTDTGVPLSLADANDKSVHVTGTLGGGSITLEGSNNYNSATGIGDWVVLTDPQGNALTFTASNKIEAIMEAVCYVRPSFVGVTNASVYVFARGQVS
jgi:hypothetical protein